ncbi:MAG: hypothetical protein K0R05_1338 [Anaerocolumna sp.]|jgi:flavodoxin|nr:hypothetical protein [Anaerocolumna sp.]
MDFTKPIHIAYFSGTGGTSLVVEALKNSLLSKGQTVTTTDVSKNTCKELNDDLLIILFPVYAFNAPKPIEKWLKRIPIVHNKAHAAVISVSGGGEISPNTACRMRTKVFPPVKSITKGLLLTGVRRYLKDYFL